VVGDTSSSAFQKPYGSRLAALGAIASMSRTGCGYDNAPTESVFHTLKVELVRYRRWNTHDEARRDLFAYIEGYYNLQRIHSAFGYLTPDQAEQMAA
jgi:putative transposase